MGLTASSAAESELIQVAIVDDHPVARRGLQSILTEAGDIQVSAAVATPAELGLERPDAVRPDVIMLDLYHDGDEPCLGVIPELRRDHQVLVVSASGRPNRSTPTTPASSPGRSHSATRATRSFRCFPPGSPAQATCHSADP